MFYNLLFLSSVPNVWDEVIEIRIQFPDQELESETVYVFLFPHPKRLFPDQELESETVSYFY